MGIRKPRRGLVRTGALFFVVPEFVKRTANHAKDAKGVCCVLGSVVSSKPRL